MSRLSIDAMSLHIPGFSPVEGRRLALEITERLNETTSSSTLSSQDISKMRINIQADQNAKSSDLAQQIVNAIVRELERAL